MHPEQMQEVVEARVTTGERRRDARCESSRGCIPIFNLRNKKDKDTFLSQVWQYTFEIDLFEHNF